MLNFYRKTVITSLVQNDFIMRRFERRGILTMKRYNVFPFE